MNSFFAQDQWTLKRLTLQGAVRYDHPWSWFPGRRPAGEPVLPRRHFAKADGVTGYHDITPRLGAAYDVFGNGKTALKVNLGKYLQGASVGNLALRREPVAADSGRPAAALRQPDCHPTWTDANGNFAPDCELTNPLPEPGDDRRVDTAARSTTCCSARTSSSARKFDPGLLSGWGVRPSDWSFGVSVQQEIFPRASVEVGYHRRTFTQFTTGGTVTDNLDVGPNDLAAYHPQRAERPASARRRRLPRSDRSTT